MARPRSLALALVALAAGALALFSATAARAVVLDLSLNVFYNSPANSASGGTWELVAKSDGFGIAGLDLHLKDIGGVLFRAPRAKVNGTDDAGFNVFISATAPNFTLGQAPLTLTAGETQGVFYGVGTLTNGAPDYPGKPAGTNSIGPSIPSLSAPQNIPWAATTDPFGDLAWASAARMLSGTFGPGVSPTFAAGNSGNIFTSTGSQTAIGDSAFTAATTIVRTNLIPNNADYNHNGIVDAADFVIWRKQNGMTVTPGLGADGNVDGIVDINDFNLWRAHFGLPMGAGGGTGSVSTSAVPEPLSALLTAAALVTYVAATTRRGRSRHARHALGA